MLYYCRFYNSHDITTRHENRDILKAQVNRKKAQHNELMPLLMPFLAATNITIQFSNISTQ